MAGDISSFDRPPGKRKDHGSGTELPEILPPLTLEESMEITKIYSIMDFLMRKPLIQSRPFRSVHHTAKGQHWLEAG